MAEIFKEAQAFDNHPDRWNHDWSHKIYGSFKFGKIYPVMTELLQPSDSIRLDIGALLQFMPTPTPLQSNVRVVFDVFFQRMKNIQESWPNYIEQLEEHTAPYILPSVSEFVPGSIHDFLGVPCVFVRHGFEDFPTMYSYINRSPQLPLQPPVLDVFRLFNSSGSYVGVYSFGSTATSGVTSRYGIGLFDYGTKHIPAADVLIPGVVEDVVKVTLSSYPFKYLNDTDAVLNSVNFRITVGKQFGFGRDFTGGVFSFLSASATSPVPGQEGFDPDAPFVVALNRSSLLTALGTLGYEDGDVIHFDLVFSWNGYSEGSSVVAPVSISIYEEKVDEWQIVSGSNTINYFVNNSYSLADFPILCPYATREFPDAPIKLRAWRYRVYESIYNAFYRNIHGNQPFIVDGVTKYNQYNTTKADGLDSTHYDFFERNWELDAYTSALPSPQQGNPPMVGISATGRLTVEDDDGTRSTAQLYDLPDGKQGLSISQINIANDEHRNIVMSLASSGFTINDLREANALQKFLETNIRKGFRYIDFIKGHFGKAPKHAEMDMPEYIGGFSVRLDVGKVTNTNAAADAQNADNVLGAFAGTAQAFGSSKHTMQYYADDYGFVQVLMTIVPDSAYSQILPKDFLYEDPLDFPFPEFGQLGYQPIDYRELCPVEAYKDYLEDNSKLLTDVFGYQRPQYEHVWKPDTLHGQFLTTMNNYVISRFFDGRPELGNAFFTIKPEETQNVFSVTKADNDIAFGQIAFKCEIKQPVPRIVIPSIGR